MTDFVSLSRAARDLPGPDTHDRLWSAWFALPAWHFIKAPSPSGWLPFSGFVNGVRCVLAFTDASRADGYARFAALPIDPRVSSPVLSHPPAAAVQLMPQLRSWGVQAMAVDPGPDAFYSPLDALFGMFRRYCAVPTPPRVVTPAPPALSIDTLLALPAWHLVTTRQDPSFPELAFRGTDLVAQIYSSAQALARFAGSPAPPTAVMPPRAVLSMLSDIELVGLVRFDGQLELELVDLELHAK